MPATVVAVWKVADADSASTSAAAGAAVVVYRVEFTSADYHPAAALSASGPGPDGATLAVAGIGSLLAGTTMTVANKSAQRLNEHPHICDVTCNYAAGGFNTAAPSGTKWNVDISCDGIEYVEAVYRDRNGKGITSSAGDPFDPPLEDTYYDSRVVVTYETNTLNGNEFDDFRGKVNSAAVSLTIRNMTRNFPVWTLRIGGGSGWSIGYSDGSFSQFRVRIELLYRKDTWRRKTIDQGYNALINVPDYGLVPFPILDGDGAPITKPALLDGAGAALPRQTGLVDAVVYPVDGWEIATPANFATLLNGIG